MSVLLKITSQNINLTSVQLLCAFVAANLLFLIMNTWFLSQQFFPVIKENQTADFFEIENYDGDRFENATFLAAASSLRLVMNNVSFALIYSNFCISDTTKSRTTIAKLAQQ
jgi:hypothetical protein